MKKVTTKTVAGIAVLLMLPVVVFAVTIPAAPGEIVCKSGDAITCIFNRILDFIWPIFIGVGVIMMIVAGFYFLLAQGEADKIKTARWAFFWAIIGIAVGVLAFSLPYVIIKILD